MVENGVNQEWHQSNPKFTIRDIIEKIAQGQILRRLNKWCANIAPDFHSRSLPHNRIYRQTNHSKISNLSKNYVTKISRPFLTKNSRFRCEIHLFLYISGPIIDWKVRKISKTNEILPKLTRNYLNDWFRNFSEFGIITRIIKQRFWRILTRT